MCSYVLMRAYKFKILNHKSFINLWFLSLSPLSLSCSLARTRNSSVQALRGKLEIELRVRMDLLLVKTQFLSFVICVVGIKIFTLQDSQENRSCMCIRWLAYSMYSASVWFLVSSWIYKIMGCTTLLFLKVCFTGDRHQNHLSAYSQSQSRIPRSIPDIMNTTLCWAMAWKTASKWFFSIC